MNRLISFEIVKEDDLVDVLLDRFSEEYDFEDLDPSIEGNIGTYIDQFKEGCYYLIESPYVDKLYRDSYYMYYASKHTEYHRDCIRVSVFNSEIDEKEFRDSQKTEALKQKFLGFFILRPTKPKIIGRSFFNSNAFEESKFYTCQTSNSVLVNGIKLQVNGFPHAKQNNENMSCAETSLWVIMEYFSHRYSYYKSVLPSEIITRLDEHAYERLLPSDGLTATDLSFVLKKFGFGTKSYSAGNYNLSELMLIYIESGIPFIATLDNKNGAEDDEDPIAHAIVICGKEKLDAITSAAWSPDDKGNFHTEQIERMVLVMDDNESPYKLVPLKKPYEDSEDEQFQNFEFKSIVVPLYPKIYLEAYQAKELAMSILEDPKMGHDFDKGYICRFLLSSGRSFKEHVSQLDSLEEIIKDLIIKTRMPKFIWCLEVYESKAALSKEVASGLILIDATEINKINSDSLLIASYPSGTVIDLDELYIYSKLQLIGYRLYPNNLR